MHLSLKRAGVVAACATALALGGVAPAFAGEITGNGQKTWTPKGASECAYSGQNDGYHDGTEPGRVQSFGQIVRVAGPLGGIPGTACNPAKSRQ